MSNGPTGSRRRLQLKGKPLAFYFLFYFIFYIKQVKKRHTTSSWTYNAKPIDIFQLIAHCVQLSRANITGDNFTPGLLPFANQLDCSAINQGWSAFHQQIRKFAMALPSCMDRRPLVIPRFYFGCFLCLPEIPFSNWTEKLESPLMMINHQTVIYKDFNVYSFIFD